MGSSGPGWSVENARPGPLLRLRVRRAYRAYEKAEQRCRRLKWEMDALEAEREAVMSAYAARRRANGTTHEPDRSDDPDLVPVLDDMTRINNRLHELAGPWRKESAAIEAAYDELQRLLREVGYREHPEGEGTGH